VLPISGPAAIIVLVNMEIMSAPLLRFTRFSGLICCLFLSNVVELIGAELLLQKVPPLTVEQAPAYPENLARYHFGAQVEAAPDSNPISNLQLSSKSEDRNTAEAALLCDDPTVGYALSNGSRTLLISLSKIENIESISFLNHGVKGDVTIATSNTKLPVDSEQWHVVSQQELTGDAMNAKVGPAEAKYIKLTFNVSEPGRIAALGVYSSPTVAAFTMPRPRKVNADESGSFALISYNVTDLHAKARALYVSSGSDLKQANNMIDDQAASAYQFGTTDGTPTAVIDLGKVMSLRRISAIYSPRQGNVDFFVLESLPGSRQGNAPKSLRLDEAALANLKSVGSVADDGSGRAAIDFPETAGRYVVVKWTPATPEDTAFSVSEIAAFGGGGGKTANLVAANRAGPSREEITSDGKTMAEAKDFAAGKEIPEEAPAEGPPPALPQPPPFVFTPEVVPASP
jgi:hypothetical protein